VLVSPPADYDKEVQAVMADLDHLGGIERHKKYLVEYITEADHEEAWPGTWNELKHDFAIYVVEVRRMNIDPDDEEDEGWTNREGQPEFNGAFG
jgi:hypothetical protein